MNTCIPVFVLGFSLEDPIKGALDKDSSKTGRLLLFCFSALSSGYTEKAWLLHFGLTSQIGVEHPEGVVPSASVAAIGCHLITHWPLIVLSS